MFKAIAKRNILNRCKQNVRCSVCNELRQAEFAQFKDGKWVGECCYNKTVVESND